jgi:hypothetical protein
MSQAGVEVVERAQQMGLLPMFFSWSTNEH